MASDHSENRVNFDGVDAEDAFIAGVLSGVVLGCENSQGLDEFESVTERVRAVTQELIEARKEALLDCASRALSQLRSDLGCSICWETIRSPVSLQCGHNFCRPCVSLWIKSRPSCPVCREPTLSYRSYSENVALAELTRLLRLQQKAQNGQIVDDNENDRENLMHRLAELEAADEAAAALETPQDRRFRALFNEISVFGRVREQGLQRHPFQNDIRNSLRERQRQHADRETVRRVFENSILREFFQRNGTQEPRRVLLLRQLESELQSLSQLGAASRSTRCEHVDTSDSTRHAQPQRSRLIDEIHSFTASRNFQIQNSSIYSSPTRLRRQQGGSSNQPNSFVPQSRLDSRATERQNSSVSPPRFGSRRRRLPGTLLRQLESLR